MTARNTELAKIHIAKKDLALDDDAYQHIIRNVGGAESGSAADLDPAGRTKVIGHFIRQGWRPRRRPRPRGALTDDGELRASDGQIKMIRSIWIQMADAGAVENRTEQGLRAWLRASTRRYHPQRAGYSAPEFIPEWVAQRVIEQLKSWAKRCNVMLHE